MIKYCGCTCNSQKSTQGAEYQDKTLGKGMRLHTGSPTSKRIACTVCGKVSNVG